MYPPHSLARHIDSALEQYLSAGYGDDPEEPPRLSPMQGEPPQSIPSQGDPLLTSIDLLDRAMGHARGQAPTAPIAQMSLMTKMGPMGPMGPMTPVADLPDLPDLLATDGDSGFDFLLSPADPQQPEASRAQSHIDPTERSGEAGRSGRGPSLQFTPSPWTFSSSPTISGFPAPGMGLPEGPASSMAPSPDEASGSLPRQTPLQGLSGLLLDGLQGPKFRMPKHHLERPHPYQRREAAKPPQTGHFPPPTLSPASDTARGPSQAIASPAVASAPAPESCGGPRAGRSQCSPSTRMDGPSPARSDSDTLSIPNTPESRSTSASPATLATPILIPTTSPHSTCSWSSRASSGEGSRASRRNSQSESVAARSAAHAAPNPESASARAGPRAASGAATVAAAVALATLKKQALRLQAVTRLPHDRLWPAEPAADFLQAAVQVNGWPDTLAIDYLDFTVHPPLRRLLRNATTEPPGTTLAPATPLPVSITRYPDGRLDAGLTSTPPDLRHTVAATPLGHLDAITCGLRWIHHGPYERALSALLATFPMPLNDLKRELNAQGHPVGNYAIALKAMAVTVRSQTAMHQLQLAMEHGQLLASTGPASRHPASDSPRLSLGK
ncbi:hypothetical protein [Roseateles terrae]|uniref:Uncharacterized protein n=1 Tax=Roseateles terrae TaxID=431060 RepID=A0ABR6GL14_9BURK|nr:hypothetical protein [Roseateles terrae]MBB3192757.1 hypothetical protein [Roseateles terrae]OWQ89966.1 hypothetical protein CDN98_05630 [Roseateles terrae]